MRKCKYLSIQKLSINATNRQFWSWANLGIKDQRRKSIRLTLFIDKHPKKLDKFHEQTKSISGKLGHKNSWKKLN